MLVRNTVKLVSVSVALVLSAVSFSDQANARGRDRERHDYPRHHSYPYGSFSVNIPLGAVSVAFGSRNFFYHSGLFYEHRDREYIVVQPPSGAVVYAIPQGYHKVVIDGVLYYTYNGVYYVRALRGYQVVQPPAPVIVEPMTVEVPAVVSMAEASDQPFIINIPDAKGSGYTSVVIKRSGNGFTGPQGEIYTEFPKFE
ncbi:MAG: DUF6515 family protein, partial [Candidatus Omnitrophota bacterium]